VLDLTGVDMNIDRGAVEAAVAGAFEANVEAKSQGIAGIGARHVEARIDWTPVTE